MVSRSFTYDSYSCANSVSVTIDSLTRASGFSYDDYHRPTAVTYPGGEVITTTYGSPGAAVGLSSSIHGALVDSITVYGGINVFEYWAEAVTDWVFGLTVPDGYKHDERGRQGTNKAMENLIRKVFRLPLLP